MSILHDLLALGRGRPRDPDPDPGFVRRKNRTVLKAALQGLTTPFKNYVNYAAFPDRIPQTADAEPHDQVIRRAVHYVNAQLGIQGLVRTDFDRELNDRLARNAIYALCERATIDYFGTAEWDVTNEKGDSQKGAVKWLRRPNPHQTMNMVLKEAVRDTIRYDAGVIVSSLRADGHLGELRAFHGPDFWIEVDRDWTALDGIGSQYYGPWSHGLVKRYWQHSRPGIYIPFEPEEITYLQLYPRTDSMYGTDFLSRVRWQLEYLIDSTKSAGMTYANGIAPGAIWKHPDYTSIEELAERELDIELNHLGPENFGGIIHLIGNESIESYSPTLHDMEWIEGQRFFTEIVLAMFGFSSSEFFQGDVNRATAYIGRNITKSRMLYPLQIHFQNMITAKILPLMEGWEDDWEFKFLDTVDLDDELKRAQINQTKASTASTYAMLGLSVEAALDLAEVDDDLRTAVKEELDDLKDQEGNWTDGIPDALPPEEAEQYYGDAGGEDYQGTAVDGDDAENQEDEEDVQKARIYLHQGEEPPKGVQVKTGPRGGKFYEATAPSRPSHMGPAPTPRPAGDEDVPLWEKDTPDPIPWKKGEQEKFLGYLRNNSLDRLEDFAEYEGMAVGPGLEISVPGIGPMKINPEHVLGRVKGGPLRIMPWNVYRDHKIQENDRRPRPPYTQEVDMKINNQGSLDWTPGYEVGTVFSRKGEVIYRKRGGAHSIEFTKDEVKLFPGNIFTHTHPSGNAFSTEDFRFACLVGLTEIRAIGPEWEYIMRPPEGEGIFTPRMWYHSKNQIVDLDEQIHELFWLRINAGELSPEEAEKTHHHTVWTRIAEATGIRYLRRPRFSQNWTDEHQLGGNE